MKTYSEMTFEEPLKYKVRLIDDEVWSGMRIDEKMEINEVLERKLKKTIENHKGVAYYS